MLTFSFLIPLSNKKSTDFFEKSLILGLEHEIYKKTCTILSTQEGRKAGKKAGRQEDRKDGRKEGREEGRKGGNEVSNDESYVKEYKNQLQNLQMAKDKTERVAK